MLKAEYTGGNNGWGNLIYICKCCGELVAEYETDEKGIPTKCIYDVSEWHDCDEDE